MLLESQNTEYKESWRDEYLKWICGFANAQGGRICIGIDDDRNIVGIDLQEAQKLTEDIPNKVRDVLGIIVDVNLQEADGLVYVEVVVPAYGNPINYKGQYHYRSGSTKQELKGAALNRFLLERTGLHWDEYLVPDVQIGELSATAMNRFRKEASENHRVDLDVLNDSDEALLKNLRLIDRRTNQLQRAAVMLFHEDPEIYVRGAYIKLGFFGGNDDDLIFQDEVHGPLMLQVDEVLTLLKERYLVYVISYDGAHRRERLIYPDEALRECLLNAIVNKDYSSGTPIQISVYPDHLVFYNSGQLPENWTVEHLFEKHSSEPSNTAIANAFFRCGDIESWGRGYRKIVRVMDEMNLRPPLVDLTGGVSVTLYNKSVISASDKKNVAVNVAEELSDRQRNILNLIEKNVAVNTKQLSEILALNRKTVQRDLNRLKDLGLVRWEGASKTGHWFFYNS